MALKLNGKDDRLTRQDFLALARTIGLTLRDADTAMNEIPDRLAKRAQTLRLPAFAGQSEAARGVSGQGDRPDRGTVRRAWRASGIGRETVQADILDLTKIKSTRWSNDGRASIHKRSPQPGLPDPIARHHSRMRPLPSHRSSQS